MEMNVEGNRGRGRPEKRRKDRTVNNTKIAGVNKEEIGNGFLYRSATQGLLTTYI